MPPTKKQRTSVTTVNHPVVHPSPKHHKSPKHKSLSPPYEIGTRGLQCNLTRANTTQPYDIDIIDRQPDPATDQFAYYVHFVDVDRRLDCWVNEDEIFARPKHQSATAKLSPAHSRIGQRTSQLSSASSDAVIDATERLLEAEHEKKTKVKNIQQIVLNDFEIDCWYYSPFPTTVTTDIRTKLYICSYCLKYMKSVDRYLQHTTECKHRHPPGTEIYRDADNNISVWEVAANQHKLYCQCLCLLSKLFIDHKTLYYDVDQFIFYILTEYTPNKGHQVVAYFSKEKQSADNNNLACILAFPPYQRRGYGKFLIALSYALTRIEQTVGSPEKPLSDLGRVAYKAYWITQIIEYLHMNVNRIANVKIDEISQNTGIKVDDTVSALQAVGLIKYVKGEHVLAANAKSVQQHYKQQQLLIQQAADKGHVLFDASKLVYTPPPAEEQVSQRVSSRRTGGAMSLTRRLKQ